jgi:cytochrome d ubiquinol oxidase subunit I
MMNQLLDITTGTIDWSRAQFALTAIYHWLFVPLTLGLAVIMGIMETCYYRTKKRFWKDAARFWQKLFGVNFAMGVATGIILEFEFGTNWSNYSWFVGDIFGAPLAIEGIIAFFMESTFVAVMFFGWKKVSAGFHLASTWLTGAGATISAWWILVANSWMQYPVGCEFNPDTMRNEMVSFADVALSPFAVDKMEALYNGGQDQSLTAVAWVNPFAQSDYVNQKEAPARIGIPNGLSILATRSFHGYVPGVNNLINGYQLPDGTKELSVAEKIAKGKKAIVALSKYREAKKFKNDADAKANLAVLNANMKYFGYGYVKSADQLVPYIPLCFWSFRVMVGMGCLLILFFAISLFYVYRKDIAKVNWLLVAGIVMLPLSYIASESGWIVAEMGRQPWTIQDMLPTWAAISDLQAGSIILTFFIFLVLFTTMLIVEISILCKQIKKGPEHSDNAQSTMQNS